ncbi:hypothetical protein SAMN05444412_10376 [Rhodonellum ikkaensis]|uniref:Transposase n=1 Tax=Rhodonellum ikkaensis TaxID=336829 RepID=A0A1H3N3L1_9BACT|nr:hypothetical protein SAMN05444412_10376 [Rhodonellum ikkaensis]
MSLKCKMHVSDNQKQIIVTVNFNLKYARGFQMRLKRKGSQTIWRIAHFA